MNIKDEDFWQLCVVAGLFSGVDSRTAARNADRALDFAKERWANGEDPTDEFEGPLHQAMHWSDED